MHHHYHHHHHQRIALIAHRSSLLTRRRSVSVAVTPLAQHSRFHSCFHQFRSNNDGHSKSSTGPSSDHLLHSGAEKMLRRFKPVTMESALGRDTITTTTTREDKLDPKNPYGREVAVTEIRLKRSKSELELTFDTGEKHILSAEFLRVESPSAEVQGHGAGNEKRLVFGKKYVKISNVEPVGNYAIRLVFDDKHDSGIYTWNYLHRLALNKYSFQKRYILALRSNNRSRYPRRKIPASTEQIKATDSSS